MPQLSISRNRLVHVAENQNKREIRFKKRPNLRFFMCSLRKLTNFILLYLISEFLLGEDTLIAPILIEGTTHRDIYLPAGYWRDENHPERACIQGPIWLKNYEAPIEMLPYFTKITANEVETLIYLQPGHYQNNWTVALITFCIVFSIYALIQIVSRFLRLRKRILTWYKHTKLNCFLPK